MTLFSYLSSGIYSPHFCCYIVTLGSSCICTHLLTERRKTKRQVRKKLEIHLSVLLNTNNLLLTMSNMEAVFEDMFFLD
jgi:hypothetical protein